METEKFKNMIVLKNLPSNLIEEAFVVIKPNKKVTELKVAKKQQNRYEKKENQKEYIVKEAELVLSDYEKQLEDKKIGQTKLERKCKCFKWMSAFLGAVSTISILFHLA